jgi:hypothetical protein
LVGGEGKKSGGELSGCENEKMNEAASQVDNNESTENQAIADHIVVINNNAEVNNITIYIY